MNKKAGVAIAIVAAIVVGYFVYNNQPKHNQSSNDTSNDTAGKKKVVNTCSAGSFKSYSGNGSGAEEVDSSNGSVAANFSSGLDMAKAPSRGVLRLFCTPGSLKALGDPPIYFIQGEKKVLAKPVAELKDHGMANYYTPLEAEVGPGPVEVWWEDGVQRQLNFACTRLAQPYLFYYEFAACN